jgi:hypothetical protein
MRQTTKSLVTMLALIGAAGAIGVAAVWVGRDEEQKAEQKEKTEKLFDFDKARVRSLRVEKAGKLVAALSRPDGSAGWDISEPIKAEGDDTAANALVDALLSLKQKKDLGDEKDGKPYGLDSPVAAVSVKTEDGKEARLEIGADNPFDSTVYVRKGGETKIRMIDAAAKAPFLKELFDLRDKSVARLEPSAELKRIEVSGTKVPYTLEKEAGAWKLAAPAGPADAAVADRLASTLKGLKATAIAAESAPVLAAFGLAPAKVTVKLVVSQGGKELSRTLLIGEVRAAVTAKTYAKRGDSPVVFEVDGQVLKDLDKDLFDLQDKQLVHVAREDVRKLVLETPGAAKIEIARSKAVLADGGAGEEEFALLAPQKGPVKKAKVSSALYAITGLRAALLGPKDLAKQGLEKPRTVTLLGDGDKVLARLRVGGETPEHRRWVLAEGSENVAQVEKGAVDELPWKLDDVLEMPAAADGGVAVSH